MNTKKTLTPVEQEKLLEVLKTRFEKNMNRHEGLLWNKLEDRLGSSPDKLWSLAEMEKTGGEPDVIGLDDKGMYVFCDCSEESPKGRRSLCYDRQALEDRKKFKPKDNVLDVAEAMGVKLLDEDEYRKLLALGSFDLKTSSWIETPAEVRKLGGAMFADYRYGKVFVYHNGADSYYASRGFRGVLRV